MSRVLPQSFSKSRRPLALLAALGLLGWPCPGLRAAGVTVITHGFSGNVTDWIIPLADRFPSHPGFDGSDFSCYQLTITAGGQATATWLGGTPPALSATGEILIKLDWASLSGFIGGASSTAVANAAAGALLSTSLIPELGGRALAELPLHLIGHSRGASVVTELARVLGGQGVWVDQVTTLDPRPVVSLGDAPVATYENVLYADNYWQDMSVPNGQALAGAYNRKLTDLSGGHASSHTDVHLWYHGTVELTTPATDSGATLYESERANWWTPAEEGGVVAGFRYSRIVGGDRLADFEPAGAGNGRISDGFNTRWDLGGGVAGNRTALPANAGLWPNVIRAEVLDPTPETPPGRQFDLEVYHQSGADADGQGTLRVLLDPDRNPWNGNEIEVGQELLAHTGPTNVTRSAVTATVDPSLVAPGLYAVCARLGEGARVRYLYATADLEVLPEAPPRIDPESFRLEEGLARFTVLAAPGQTVAIMASEDLKAWVAIATRTFDGTPWEFTDPDTQAFPDRFYQAEPAGE